MGIFKIFKYFKDVIFMSSVPDRCENILHAPLNVGTAPSFSYLLLNEK